MIISLESKKLKRTGFLPTFIVGGLLAALVPIVNMAVRSEIYIGLEQSSLRTLIDANWQMMAMLNILLIVSCACIMYHTEYADNAIQRMKTLPLKESTMFLGKLTLLVIVCMFTLIIEAAALAFCAFHWFPSYAELPMDLVKNIGYIMFLTLPTAVLMLSISSACKNMWVSLGIGVICVFTATMLPTTNFVLSLFPFSLPFQTLIGTESSKAIQYICAVAAETVLLGIAEFVYLKVRRSFE